MRNEIHKIENLENLQRLKVLNLGKNRISRIQGLQYCQSLEKLILSHQRTKNTLTFEQDSLIGISQNLVYLDLENNRINAVHELGFLPYIDYLNLKDNLIESPFVIEDALVCMKGLRTLFVDGNPLCNTEKWRDMVVMMALNLQELNDKKILVHEREFLFRLHQKKS